MSEKNGYIKNEDLSTLSKEELVEKVITARKCYRENQKSIESLTDQVGKAIDDIEKLNTTIEERDEQIAALHAQLEALCEPIAIACRQIGDVKDRLKPYWKKPANNGGQNASAPSE